MTVLITPGDGLRVEYETPEEAAECLRDLKLYKALLLLRRGSLERLMAEVDGWTLRLSGIARGPAALPGDGERRGGVTDRRATRGAARVGRIIQG